MNEKNKQSGFMEAVRNSHILRILYLSILAAVLLIPIGMVDNTITERQSRREEIVKEVTSKWGERQTIVGPMLIVPYLDKITETDDKGKKKVMTVTRYAAFLPETLRTTGKIRCDTRYRGIYKIPVYSSDLDISGVFSHPDFSELGINARDVIWDRAYLSLGISDARAITNQVALRWNDKQIQFLPEVGESDGKEHGIHVPLKGRLSGESFKFSCNLKLNGSEEISFVPFGKETQVEISSNWTSPSFQGNRLPSGRNIDKNGFRANWKIPYLGRNYPQQWKVWTGYNEAVLSSQFGIRFLDSLDHYSMAKRSTKYGILFVVMTFITLWLFELLAKVRIHPIQYLLVGGGLCLFFLLEISMAEHIGFMAAYLGATLLITSLIFFYCMFILGGLRRSTIIASVIMALYGYLYVLLMNQDYALLIGSICLFLVLATIMFITRKLDWYSHKNAGKKDVQEPESSPLPTQGA